MSTPANMAKAQKTGQIDPMSPAIAGVPRRASKKFRNLKITAQLLNVSCELIRPSLKRWRMVAMPVRCWAMAEFIGPI